MADRQPRPARSYVILALLCLGVFLLAYSVGRVYGG